MHEPPDSSDCSALLRALDGPDVMERPEMGAEEYSAHLDSLDADVLDELDREMSADDCRDLLDALDDPL